MRLGRMEVTFRDGEVVTAHADGILGDSASELMQLNPAQGSVPVVPQVYSTGAGVGAIITF